MSPTIVYDGRTYAMMHDPVGAACTAFAVEVLHSSVAMGEMVQRTVDGRDVVAHVEPHTWTNRGGVVVRCDPSIRGVTLYEAVAAPITVPSPAPLHEPPLAPGFARGCDVSHYQGGGLRWAELARQGCAFAYCKASEGARLVDDAFVQNAEHTRAAGILRGGYHFFRPTVDVPTQVRLFVGVLKSAGDLELPPALDVEVSDGVAPGVLAASVEHFLELLSEELGRGVIYTAPGWWRAHTGDSHLAAKADLWVAHWGVSKPSLCGDWADWLFWQTADRSSFAGDADVFNGSAEELRAAFGG